MFKNNLKKYLRNKPLIKKLHKGLKVSVIASLLTLNAPFASAMTNFKGFTFNAYTSSSESELIKKMEKEIGDTQFITDTKNSEVDFANHLTDYAYKYYDAESLDKFNSIKLDFIDNIVINIIDDEQNGKIVTIIDDKDGKHLEYKECQMYDKNGNFIPSEKQIEQSVSFSEEDDTDFLNITAYTKMIGSSYSKIEFNNNGYQITVSNGKNKDKETLIAIYDKEYCDSLEVSKIDNTGHSRSTYVQERNFSGKNNSTLLRYGTNPKTTIKQFMIDKHIEYFDDAPEYGNNF